MAEILRGKEVADHLDEISRKKAAALKERGVTPLLAILRVGYRDSDTSYERGAMKRCRKVGVEVRSIVLPEDVDKDEFYRILEELNNDPAVHGILMFRPLPRDLDNEKARQSINPDKDVDGCGNRSLGGIFINKKMGYAPCTAEAAIQLLDYYGIEIAGKKVTIIGRSLVVGKPLAMLLLNRNATVTVCHSRSVDIPSITKDADIIISCTGQMESVNAEYVREGQTVIDIGISYNNKKQKLCGDVLFEEVEPIVGAITPVPGGAGSVTTSVLVSHVIQAAEEAFKNSVI